MKGQDCSVTITEKESGISRAYLFKKGKVKTTRRDTDASDISLVWSDPAKGARYMMAPTPSAMTKAVSRGHLGLKGDASYFSWFLSLVKELPV